MFFLFLLPVLFEFSCSTTKTPTTLIDQYKYDTQKKVVCENGAVVSAHPLASKVGLAVLKMGGNAPIFKIANPTLLASGCAETTAPFSQTIFF